MKPFHNVRIVLAILISIALTWVGCSEQDNPKRTSKIAQELDSLTDVAFALQYNNAAACDSIAQIILEKSLENDYKKGSAYAWFLKSSAQQQLSNFDSAIVLAYKSLSIFIDIDNKKGQARIYNDLGINYDFKANYAKAIDNYLKALNIFEKLDDKKGISNALNNIGLIYQNQKNYNEARAYHRRALAIAMKNKLPKAELNALNSLGSIFVELGDYDSALFYHQKVLEGDIKSGNQTYISYSYNNIGEAYLHKKEFDKAIFYFKKSKQLKENLGLQKPLANTLMNMGEAYMGLKDFDAAENSLTQSLAISIPFKLAEINQTNYMLLHRLAIEKQNYKQALTYYKEAEKIKTEINHDREMAEISRLEKIYEVDKAQRLLNETEKNAAYSNKLAILYGSLAIILFILVSSFAYGYSQKKKTNNTLIKYQKALELRNNELNDKNELVNTQKKELEAALSARSRFLSFMSHEIRTPLNGITGLVDLLLAMPMIPDQKEYMDALKQSADNLLLLLNNILDLSKLEAGKIELEKRNLNLHKLLEEQTTLFKANAMLKGVALELSVDEQIPKNLQGDSYRLTQIIANLISNAIKFSRDGKVKLEVKHIKSEANNHTIKFAVIDNGIGISSDKLKSIVEPFSQAETHTTRKYGGTGLGLAIVQLLLNAMNSQIEIESEPNKGSTFAFTLEFPTYETPIISESEDILVTKGVEDVKNKKVLVVEDNTTNILVLTKVLAGWQLEYDVANDGYKAIEYITEKKYDIILMDLHLPKITGYDTAQRIKTTSNINKETPILAISAADKSEIEQHPQKHFLDGVMYKPVQTQILLDNINQLLA